MLRPREADAAELNRERRLSKQQEADAREADGRPRLPVSLRLRDWPLSFWIKRTVFSVWRVLATLSAELRGLRVEAADGG